MAQEPIEEQQTFKDYYEILHLHGDADAAMVDQAYWHLARLYNAAIPDDADARGKLDDLNEAYSVLRSAELRASYDAARNELLSKGALPESEVAEQDELPLAVMAKQKPKARKEEEPKEKKPRQLPPLPWQSVVAVVASVGVAGGSLAIGLPLAVASGLLITGLLLALVLLVAGKLPSLPALPSTKVNMPSLRAPRLPERSSDRDSVSPDSLHESTLAMRERWRTETHDSTSGLPENTIWPKEMPAPDMQAQNHALRSSEPEANKPISLIEASRGTRPTAESEEATTNESASGEAAPSFSDAVGELRRKWRADVPQDVTSAPNDEPEFQAQPASVLREEDDASVNNPGSLISAEPTAEGEQPAAGARLEPAAVDESFSDAVGALRRRWRTDAPQEVPTADLLDGQGDASDEDSVPPSVVNGPAEPVTEEDLPEAVDAPEQNSPSEGLADSLGALRRKWRAEAPTDLSSAFPQHTVWPKLDSSETESDEDAEDPGTEVAADPE